MEMESETFAMMTWMETVSFKQNLRLVSHMRVIQVRCLFTDVRVSRRICEHQGQVPNDT